MRWWAIGMRWWWWAGGAVSVSAGWIHPPRGRLGRSLARRLSPLLLVFVLLILTASIIVCFLASSTFPNKRCARKRTVRLLLVSPTRWYNPRSDEWRTTKSRSKGLGFLRGFVLACGGGCARGWRVRETRRGWHTWHAGKRKRRVRRSQMGWWIGRVRVRHEMWWSHTVRYWIMMWRRPGGVGVWIGPWHSIRRYEWCCVLLWSRRRGGSGRSGVPRVRESGLPLI